MFHKRFSEILDLDVFICNVNEYDEIDILSLEDILAGNAITQLHKITNCPLTSSVHIFYQHWLETQSYNETMFNKSFRRSQYQD
jgi:hypothetical protein